MFFFEHETMFKKTLSKNLDREHQKTITNVRMTKFHKSVTNLNRPQELVNTLGIKIWFFSLSSIFYAKYLNHEMSKILLFAAILTSLDNDSRNFICMQEMIFRNIFFVLQVEKLRTPKHPKQDISK